MMSIKEFEKPKIYNDSNEDKAQGPREKISMKEKVQGILEKRIRPKNRFEHQMVLALELYRIQNPNEEVDLESVEKQNTFMFNWSDGGPGGSGESWSKIYKDIEDHQEFKNHPRIMGDSTNIELDDVIYFSQYRKLQAN